MTPFSSTQRHTSAATAPAENTNSKNTVIQRI